MIDIVTLGRILVSGTVLGSLYTLMSIGLTIIWGTVGILNFAHGVVISWGAYIFYLLSELLGINFWLSIIISICASFCIGALLELLIFRPFRGRPGEMINTIYGSLALANILTIVALILFGPRYKKLPYILSGYLEINNIRLMSYHELFLIMFTISVLLIFWIFLKINKYGMAMRALSQDRLAAQLMGINVNRVYLLTISIGCTFAGIAGIFLGSIHFVSPYMGEIPLIIAFVVIVFGGLGSIKGTIISAYVLGIVQALAGYFLGLGWAMPIFFLFMMLTILFRPTGLLGERL